MNNKYIKLFVVMVMSFFVSMTITSAARYEDINSLLAEIEELETEDNPIDYVYIIGNHVFTGSFQYSLKDLNDASRTIPDGVSSYMYYVERIINSDFEPTGWDIEGARDAYGSELKLEGPFTITHVDLVLDEDYSSAKEVAQAKADAIEALDEYRSLLEDLKGTYNTNGNELDNIVENLKTSIADLNDLEAINHQLELAKESMNAIESDKEIADKANAELSQAKAEAIESLVSQAGDMKETHSSQYEEVLTTVTDAIADIQAATEKDEIESILNDAIEALENMDSDALVNAKNDAKAELNSYPEELLNHKLSQAEIDEIVTKYEEKINNATDADALDGILEEAQAELENIQSDETVVENKVNALTTTLEEFKDTFANGIDELKPEDLEDTYSNAIADLDNISEKSYETAEALTEALTEAENSVKESILNSVKAKVQEVLKNISTDVDDDNKVVPTSKYLEAVDKLAKDDVDTYDEILAIYNELKDTPKVDVSENSLEVAKTEAQAKFDQYKAENYTREENKDDYATIKTDFDSRLKSATTVQEVADLIAEIIPKLEKIQPNSYYEEIELQAAKTAADGTLTSEIAKYNQSNYSTANRKKFTSIKTKALSDVESAKTVEEVQAIIDQAKNDMEDISTIAEQKEEYANALQEAYDEVKDNYKEYYSAELETRINGVLSNIEKAKYNKIDNYAKTAETYFLESTLEKANIYSDEAIKNARTATIAALDEAIASIDNIDSKIRQNDNRTYLNETQELIKSALTDKINLEKVVPTIEKYKDMEDETTKALVVDTFRNYVLNTLMIELDDTQLLTSDKKNTAIQSISSASDINTIIDTFNNIQLQTISEHAETRITEFKNKLTTDLEKDIKLYLIVSKDKQHYNNIEGVSDIVNTIVGLKSGEYNSVNAIEDKLTEITNQVLNLVKPYIKGILTQMKDKGFDSEYGYLSQEDYTIAIGKIDNAIDLITVINAYEEAIDTIKKVNVSNNVDQEILNTYLAEDSKIEQLNLTESINNNLDIKNPNITIVSEGENIDINGTITISGNNVNLKLDNVTLNNQVTISGNDVTITGSKDVDGNINSFIKGSIKATGDKVTIDTIKIEGDKDKLIKSGSKSAVIDATDKATEFNLSNSEIGYSSESNLGDGDEVYSLLHLNGNTNLNKNKFNIANVKNPIEFKWKGTPVQNVNITNNEFVGDNYVSGDSHNIISIYKVAEENAEINIIDNKFQYANSVLRISNPDDYKVTYNVVRNTVGNYSYKTGSDETALIVIRVNSNIDLSKITINHLGNTINGKNYEYNKNNMETNSETRLVYVKKDSGKEASNELDVQPYTE